MNKLYIETKIIEITTESTKVKNHTVTLDSRFKQDLRLDSLSITELVIAIEDEYNIEIDMDHPDVANATTLRSLFHAVVLLTDSTD
jgi:acyl carrier protein